MPGGIGEAKKQSKVPKVHGSNSVTDS